MNSSTIILLLCSLNVLIQCNPVPEAPSSHRVKRWGGYGYGGYGGRGFYPGGGGFYPGGGGGFYPGGGGFYPGGGGGFGNRWGSSIGLSANLRLGGFNNGFLFG